jgi:predicted deacylase
MNNVSLAFPSSYEDSRARFRQYLELVQRRWPGARLGQHRLRGDEDLTIDWLEAEPVEGCEQVLVVTTGEHGIEAYVGAAMLQRLVEGYLPRLDPRRTGLLLVHTINPWGMKHRRRVNRDNIDLNRTFIWSPPAAPTSALHDPAFNPDYARLTSVFEPTGELGSFTLAELSFIARLVAGVAQVGLKRLGAASALGQYAYPRGIHYGGTDRPEETGVLMELYRQCFERYAHVVQIDMHTGYGPRYQMSVVTSEIEARASAELRRQFGYPLVAKANAAEFYALKGDMIDYVYTLRREEFPDRRLFSTTLEFGTLGDSLLDRYHDRRAVVFENRLHWYGVSRPAVRARVEHDFKELFFPEAPDWCAKALADFDQATDGILRAESVLTD